MGDSRIALECVEQESVVLVEEARLWQGRARGASGFVCVSIQRVYLKTPAQPYDRSRSTSALGRLTP